MDKCLSEKLKFEPNYYRIWTPEELETAEREQLERASMQSDTRPGEEEKKSSSGSGGSGSFGRQGSSNSASAIRKYSQTQISFPATPAEITHELLGNVDEDPDEDDEEGGTRFKFSSAAAEETKNEQKRLSVQPENR